MRADATYILVGQHPRDLVPPRGRQRLPQRQVRLSPLLYAGHALTHARCSEDGRIILHDARLTRAPATLQHSAAFTGVQYHPRMAHVFATSDHRGRVCLRDVRMAFGPRGEGVVQMVRSDLVGESLCCDDVGGAVCDDGVAARGGPPGEPGSEQRHVRPDRCVFTSQTCSVLTIGPGTGRRLAVTMLVRPLPSQ